MRCSSRLICFDSAGCDTLHRTAARRVVKAFNTLPAGVYDAPDRQSRLALFLCGDDADARQVVTRLILDAGFAPVDAGPMSAAQLQEPGGPRYNSTLSGPPRQLR